MPRKYLPLTLKQKKQRSETMKKYWATHPEAKKNLSKFFKGNREVSAKIDRAVTKWWKEHPNIRKERAEKLKKFYAQNPKALIEFIKHGTNSLKPHLKTNQGFIVRSKGEQQIANFLYKNKIHCQYESISLPITTPPFAGNICTPDFFLPKQKIFIEFYGGYPAAWKKKVLKNKIYKSHKIPVISITPGELRNLDYYLLREIEEG